MNRHDRRLLIALLRSDFESFLRRCLQTLNPNTPFQPNWHITAITHRLNRAMSGRLTRLIINIPPRHLKSLLVSVVFPAWLLGHKPWTRIFCISYGGELALKHARDFRMIVESPWYRSAFPEMRLARSLEDEVATTARGFRKTTSVMGPLTGLGGDMFIIDDPLKAMDALSTPRREALNDWVANTLMSRLDNKETGAIIVVMQRVHVDDLSGFLMKSPERWDVLSLPAIAEAKEKIEIGENTYHIRRIGEALHEARESSATLEALRQTLGSDVFAAQYQQSPIPPGGNMIKRRWIERYTELPPRGPDIDVLQSWDTASKEGGQNDWCACSTFFRQGNKYYLAHVLRERLNYPDLKATAISHAQAYEADTILIEDTGVGTGLIAELQDLGLPAIEVKVKGSKVVRLAIQSAKFKSGQVFLPRSASWLEVFESELFAFPGCRHDDQVDSISQALAYNDTGYDTSLRWVTGE
ncbi:MAG: phage terminase large subunit [Pseudorhodoplanes sp.]